MSRKATPEQVSKAQEKLVGYLETHPSITNRQMRAMSGLSYDQCIAFFNEMVRLGIVARNGQRGGTSYTAISPPSEKPTE
jgi:hypothetical protein